MKAIRLLRSVRPDVYIETDGERVEAFFCFLGPQLCSMFIFVSILSIVFSPNLLCLSYFLPKVKCLLKAYRMDPSLIIAHSGPLCNRMDIFKVNKWLRFHIKYILHVLWRHLPHVLFCFGVHTSRWFI